MFACFVEHSGRHPCPLVPSRHPVMLAAHLQVLDSKYLSTCLSVCLSIYLSIYLSSCPPTHLFVYLSVYIYLSICPPVYLDYLSIHPSIHPSICLSIHPSTCLPVYLSICLSIHLSIDLSCTAHLHLDMPVLACNVKSPM